MRRVGVILLLFSVLSAKPIIGNVYFDGRPYQSGNAIARQPEIKLEATSDDSDYLDIDGVKAYLNSRGSQELVIEVRQNIDEDFFLLRPQKELPPGQHELIIVVNDNGYFYEEAEITLTVNVLAGRDLQGDMVLFPSPSTGNINVCYELGAPQDVSLLIYNINGQLVCRRDFFRGQQGGNGGYNQVLVNLETQSRRPLGNGVYIAALLNKSGSRSVLAREKFILLR